MHNVFSTRSKLFLFHLSVTQERGVMEKIEKSYIPALVYDVTTSYASLQRKKTMTHVTSFGMLHIIFGAL